MKLYSVKPDPRETISELWGWIGDAEEIQRLEDNGDLERTILAHKYSENMDDPEDPGDDCADLVNECGAKALEVCKQWKAVQSTYAPQSGQVYLSIVLEEYLSTKPYGPTKTMRDCELSIGQFREFTGDIQLTEVTLVLVHQYAEKLAVTIAFKTIRKKIGYVSRMFAFPVRKGLSISTLPRQL